jgi:hypothetical protein
MADTQQFRPMGNVWVHRLGMTCSNTVDKEGAVAWECLGEAVGRVQEGALREVTHIKGRVSISH